MRIAQVSATFPPYHGGTGNVCYNYALELARLGHEVTVFTSNPSENLNYNYSDLIKVKSFKPLFRIGNAPFIPELLKINDYDIIHLHYPFFFGAEMIFLLNKLKSKKYIITYHNDVIFEGLMGKILKIYNKTFMKWIMNNAEKVCVTSMDYAENSELKQIIDSTKSDVLEIPNGINLDDFKLNKSPEKLKDSYNLQNKNIILFVGALDKPHYFKGVKYLLKSFKKVLENKKTNNPYLIIVGEGDLKTHYMLMSKKLGINKKTFFTGSLSDSELLNYYKMADMVILPSVTMGEAFGVVLLEAMALSKPVIASNLPGVRTVVDDGINGFLVEPKDVNDLASRINYLFEKKELRKTMGQFGKEKVEKQYLWPKIIKKLEKAYNEVLM